MSTCNQVISDPENSDENLENMSKYLNTLIMFYKQRPNKETSWHMSSFDSRCLTVAYFLLKI